MKASLKFRGDEQKPLLRAKLPLNVVNFPFQSGLVAGHSKELSLHLTTFFHSGPSLKLAYHPNDPSNPFTLVLKTGTGNYGSPIDSSMVISAQFNLLGHTRNPTFFLHVRPRFGDFRFRKKQSSLFANIKDHDDSINMPAFPGMNKIKSLPSASTVADRLLTGVDMTAATSLPVFNLAHAKFQWGLRFSTEMKNMLSNKDGLVMKTLPAVSFHNIPFLVMNKISIEQARDGKTKDTTQADPHPVVRPPCEAKDDVSIMSVGVRHQLEALHVENGMLRKAVEDLRSEISCGKVNPFAGEMKNREVSRGAANKPTDYRAESRQLDHPNPEGKKQ
uniref:Uncharacterized protein n=1 Tax=Kalanchoe fedtschenkoi TaxID=63787 RepID=A0A7N1A361_KALFE